MADTPDYRTIEGLKQHPLFQLLTNKQQRFLLAYLKNNGDRLAAATESLRPKNEPAATAAAIRMLRTVYVRKLISLYHGFDVEQAPMSRTELNGLIAARLRRADVRDVVFTRLAELLIESRGWTKKKDNRREESLGDVLPKRRDTDRFYQKDDVSINDLVRKLEDKKKPEQTHIDLKG